MPRTSSKKSSASSKKSSTSSSSSPKNKKCLVKAYCLKCKKNVTIESQLELIRKTIPNKNTVSILCGRCPVCDSKVCKIIANTKS